METCHSKRRFVESAIQQTCVEWFRWKYHSYNSLLFSVPNGGARSPKTAALMKAEGVVAGVSDLILMVPRHNFHALCIEMKTSRGFQSDMQKTWQSKVEEQGYRYVICKSLNDFQKLIDEYLG